jgi:hypothetical protein
MRKPYLFPALVLAINSHTTILETLKTCFSGLQNLYMVTFGMKTVV